MRSIFISHNAAQDGEVARRLRDELLESEPDDRVMLSSDSADSDAAPAGGTAWQSWIVRTVKSCDVIVLVASEGSLSPWCSAELGMARLLNKPIIPLHTGSTDHLNPVVGATQAAPIDQPIQAIQALIDARLGPASSTPVGPDFVPYPGLVPLDDGAPLFGRVLECRRILGDLAAIAPGEPSVLVISGPSGSGKSSLARAGLLRPLREQGWSITGPIQPLKLALDGFPAIETGARRMLVVDQAEELFDLDDGRRSTIERALADCLAAGMTLLFVIRIEFRDQLGGVLANMAATKPTDHYIPFVDLHALDDIIREPARLAQLDIGEQLVGRLVAETGSGEALPLLAYTLNLLWEDRDREHHKLREATLDRLGGVNGVLVNQAQQAFQQATRGDPGLREPVLKTLSRLASPAHQPPTRSPVRLQLLSEDERTWIDEFRAAGLVAYRRTYDIADTIDQNTQPTGDDLADVTHEALFGWPPLRSAIDSNRKNNALLVDITRTAERWHATGRADATLLIAGDNLTFALEAELDTSLDPSLQDFVLASKKNDRDRRRARRLTLATAVFAVLAAVLLVVSIVQLLRANDERDRATQAETVAESIGIAAQANSLIDTDRALAMIGAVAAYQVDANSVSEASLLNVLATPTGPVRYYSNRQAFWRTLRMLDGERGVVVTSLRQLALVDLATREISPVSVAQLVGVEIAEAIPNKTGVVAVFGRRPPSSWRVGFYDPHGDSGDAIDHPVEVTVALALPTGLIYGDVDGGVYLAPVVNGTIGAPVNIDEHETAITDIALAEKVGWLATASAGGIRSQRIEGTSWEAAGDLTSITPGARTAERLVITLLAGQPDEQLYAAGSDPEVRHWTATQQGFVEQQSLGFHGAAVRALTADRAGTMLYSGGVEGQIRRWNLATGASIGSGLSAHKSDVLSLSAGAGHLVVSSDADRAVLWDLADSRRVERKNVYPQSWNAESFTALSQGNGPLGALTLDDRILSQDAPPLSAPPGGRKLWSLENAGWVVETGDREQTQLAPLALWHVRPDGQIEDLGVDLDAADVGSCVGAMASRGAISFVDVGGCAVAVEPISVGERVVQELALSQDESRLLVVFADNALTEFDLDTGSALRMAPQRGGIAPTSASWLSNDLVVIGHDRGGPVTFVDLDSADGASVLEVDAHQDAVWWLVTNSSGDRLFSAGHDGLIVQTDPYEPAQIGDPLIGTASERINDNNAAVRGLKLIEDDSVLLALHGDEIVAWELDPEQLAERACFDADRMLEPADLSILSIEPDLKPCEGETQ